MQFHCYAALVRVLSLTRERESVITREEIYTPQFQIIIIIIIIMFIFTIKIITSVSASLSVSVSVSVPVSVFVYVFSFVIPCILILLINFRKVTYVYDSSALVSDVTY